MGFTCCVIGAGPAGIATAMNMRRAGAMVTCMELNSTVGGIWAAAHGPTAGTHGGSIPGSGYSALGARGLLSPIYPSMKCVLPKDSMAFSDQRFSFLVPQYPHYAAVHEYLQEYATRKGIHGLVRYNTWVEKIQWLGEERTEPNPSYVENLTSSRRVAEQRNRSFASSPDQKKLENVWLVRTVNVVNGDVTEWKFDCVIVATGRHHRPRIPDPFYDADSSKPVPPNAPQVMPPIPGQIRYLQAGGQVLHNSEVKRFRDWTGKTVVVYGTGVSAFEYVKELQRAGAMVIHATERETPPPDDSASDDVSEMVINSSAKHFKRLAARWDPLQNPRFVANLLKRRNQRLRQSLRATLHNPSGFGEYDKMRRTWIRDYYRPTAAAPADGVTPPMTDSLEALRGLYASVPVLGAITRFGARDKPAKKVTADASSAATPSNGDAADEAENTTAHVEEDFNDRDAIIAITNLVSTGGAAAADDKKSTAAAAAAAAAADAVADASLTGGVNRLSSMHNPTRLLNMLRKAEYSPFEPRSVALLSRFKLVRGGEGGEVTGLCVKNCDAVICCTGYYQSFPYIADESIRADVEFASRRPQLKIEPMKGTAATDAEAAAADPERQHVAYNGLYLGTLLRRNPTLAFIGLQAEMVPPFLLFEAQSAYVAAAMTARVPIPATEQLMTQRELELGMPHRRLAALQGLGVGGSAAYYTALLREAGIANSHYGYYETMWTARRQWFLGTWLVNGAHAMWSLTPQQRKKQHTIISNEI